MEEQILELTISEEDQSFKRLDAYLADAIPDLSRSLIKKLFLDGKITSTNPTKLELKKLPPVGTEILIEIPKPAQTKIEPQNIPLDILFEDEHLIIINKQAGLVVHPAPGNWDGTLVNAIMYHCKDIKGIGNELRPGIVHRLDKGTSGVMVVAKSQKCHEGLVKLFSEHDIERRYEAIVVGAKLPSIEKIESTIGRNKNNRLKMQANVPGGKTATTNLKVLKIFKSFSHVELKLETGRTHQIRVHLSQIKNTPILNDPLYGRTKEERSIMPPQLKGVLGKYEHPFLHARILGFIHPITGEKIHYEADHPQIFNDVLECLDNYE